MSEIQQGTYKAVAVPVEVDGVSTYVQFGMTKGGNGKTPTKQVAVQFEILEGPSTGSRLTWFGYFTEKTWQRTIEALRICGFKGDDLMDAAAQKLVQEVSVVIEPNTYEGKTTMRIAWVNKSSSGVKLAAPMNAADLRQFSAMMKSRVNQVKPVEGKKADAGKAEEPTTPPPADDDPPF